MEEFELAEQKRSNGGYDATGAFASRGRQCIRLSMGSCLRQLAVSQAIRQL